MKQHLESLIVILFLIMWGIIQKQTVIKIRNKNNNHIACNKPDKNNKINTQIEIEMTNAI